MVAIRAAGILSTNHDIGQRLNLNGGYMRSSHLMENCVLLIQDRQVELVRFFIDLKTAVVSLLELLKGTQSRKLPTEPIVQSMR